MTEQSAQVFDSAQIPAPFIGPNISVRNEWLDYNGHVTDSAYAVMCTAANEAFLEYLGVSADYLARTDCTTYTVEAHLRYLAEVAGGATITSETILVDADAKRLRIHTALFDGETQVLTGEYLYLHMDQSAGKVSPFPQDRADVLAAVKAVHAALDQPAHIGRGVGAPRV
ncbi:MAG: thioesterase family protein [Actinomycetes bacterium]